MKYSSIQNNLFNENEIDDIKILDILEQYLQWLIFERKKKTVIRYLSSKRILQHFFQEKRITLVNQISRKIASEFVTWRLSQKNSRGKLPSKRSVNIDLTTLRCALDWAFKREIIEYNPICHLDGILLKEKANALPCFFSVEELKILEELSFQHNPCLYKAIAVLARTGMRSGEFCTLTSNNIDLERKQIRLMPEQTKADYWRIIPLTDKVWDIVSQETLIAKKAQRLFIFCNSKGGQHTTENLNRRFRNLLNLAEKLGKMQNTKHFHIHCLRATFISHLAMSGEAPLKIMAIVGHRDWQTMKKYLGFVPGYFADIKKLPY